MSIVALHTQEIAANIGSNSPDYVPPLNRQLIVGSQVVAALVGPPKIGRLHILEHATELMGHSSITVEASLLNEEVALRREERSTFPIVGVITEPPIWYHRFSQAYPHHLGIQRAAAREEAIACLTWLRDQDPEEIPILYNQNNQAGFAAKALHDYVIKGEKFEPASRKTLDHLIIAAESMGV